MFYTLIHNVIKIILVMEALLGQRVISEKSNGQFNQAEQGTLINWIVTLIKRESLVGLDLAKLGFNSLAVILFLASVTQFTSVGRLLIVMKRIFKRSNTTFSVQSTKLDKQKE